MMRLDKLLAEAGTGSRSQVKEYIRKGRITVNGQVCKKPEQKVSEEEDQICLDGQAVEYVCYRYYMLHKPQGVITATEDTREKTVLDLLVGVNTAHISPVGRLDKDTEGLLLLTNDGELAHRLLSPKRHVDKIYYAKTAGRLTEEDCRAFAAGLTLEDGLVCLPAGLDILSTGEVSEAHVTLREGKFHQVKRMLAARGKPVLYLERVQMGPLPLDRGLRRGAFRFLTEEEIKGLRALV